MAEHVEENDAENPLSPSTTVGKAEESLLTDQGKSQKQKSPEPRRRKYSLASVMKRLERKPEDVKENKEDTKERKGQKRENSQHSKGIKKGIFHKLSKHNKVNENENCNVNIVQLIPPVPSQLGYDDLLIEEVKPRAGTIIHASENVLLSDVHRPRSPRNFREQQRSKSDPPSPSSKTLLSPSSAAKFRNGLKSDSGYEDSIEGSRGELVSTLKENPSRINAEIRSLAQIELCKVLKGKFYQEKQVRIWSKMISEGIMLKIRKLTNSEKKIIAAVFIGEKYPGTVKVHISYQNNTETDNFQTVSTQFNNIYAWVSIIGMKT